MRSIEWIESRILAGRADHAWRAVELALANADGAAESEQLLLDGTFLALHYGGKDRIERWIAEFLRRRSSHPVAQAIVAAVRVTVAWSEREDARALELAGSVPWDLLLPRPWARTLRFCLLSQSGADREALAYLDGLESVENEHDRATRELFVLTHHAARGRLRTAVEIAFRALDRLRPLSGLRARIREVQVLAELGSTLGRMGRSEDAIRSFERMFALSQQLGLSVLERMYCEEFAQLYADAGRFEDAYDVLGRVPLDRESALPRDLLQRARRHICHAEIYAEEEDPSHGVEHASEALGLLLRCPHARLHAHALLVLGRLLVLVPRKRHFAERALNDARHRFRALGEEGRFGLSCTLTARGEMLLALGRVEEALECLHESLQVAPGVESIPARSRRLILKSRLLLEGAFERPEREYEQLLTEVGHVRGRTARLRALANLLVYSWRLRHGEEIGRRYHLEICRLESHIDRPVFRRLYKRYVQDRLHPPDASR